MKPTPRNIECPQCKENIIIARPRSRIVEIVRVIERATGRLLMPFVFVTLAGTVLTGCWMHGLSTVFVMCGPEDAERLLGVENGLQISSTLGLSLPLIPLVLIGARTHHLDTLLPIIPIFYFASNAPRREGPLWPPSAAFTLSTLPYIRAAYNEFYSRILAPKEKEWKKEIQPRDGEPQEGGPEARHGNEDAENIAHEGMNFELNLQVELVDEEEADHEAEEIQQQPEQPAGNLPEVAGNQLEEGQGQNQEPDQQHNPPHPHPVPPLAANQDAAAAGNVIIDTVAYAQKVIGALVFPTVAAAMGVLLKAALPRTWTVPPGRWDRYPTGFLQSRFGRSIAGGCLFVALRDTLLLYSKYRLAYNHRNRRIVDYVAKKGKKTKSTKS